MELLHIPGACADIRGGCAVRLFLLLICCGILFGSHCVFTASLYRFREGLYGGLYGVHFVIIIHG